jgi:hypothetical protein
MSPPGVCKRLAPKTIQRMRPRTRFHPPKITKTLQAHTHTHARTHKHTPHRLRPRGKLAQQLVDDGPHEVHQLGLVGLVAQVTQQQRQVAHGATTRGCDRIKELVDVDVAGQQRGVEPQKHTEEKPLVVKEKLRIAALRLLLSGSAADGLRNEEAKKALTFAG